MSNYRIRRYNKRNLVIETRTDPDHHLGKQGEHWATVGYFGNDAKALASGLMSLVLAGCTPDPGGDLCEQIKSLRQSIDDGITKILSEIKNGKSNEIAAAGARPNRDGNVTG